MALFDSIFTGTWSNLRMAKLLNTYFACVRQPHLTWPTWLIYSFFCLILFYTLVYYDCFLFVCTFESLCLNYCKMKGNKQRTLFEFDAFAKRRNGKARIPSLLVVRMSNVAIVSDEMSEMAPALTLHRGSRDSQRLKSRQWKFNCRPIYPLKRQFQWHSR